MKTREIRDQWSEVRLPPDGFPIALARLMDDDPPAYECARILLPAWAVLFGHWLRRAGNYTMAAVLLLAVLYFGIRIGVAFASGRARQIIGHPDGPQMRRPIADERAPQDRVISLEVIR